MTANLRGRHATAPAESKSHGDWHDVLEWAEKQGLEGLKTRFATAEIIAKEAQATLTVLLAGIGGSATYAAKLFEPTSGSASTWGFAVTCVYLIVCSIFLIARCMRFESYPALFQTPTNLMQRAYSLDELREVELENLSDRIREAAAINQRRGQTLNKVRLAAALSPVVFGSAALCAIGSHSVQKSIPVTISCTSSSKAASSSAVALNCVLGS